MTMTWSHFLIPVSYLWEPAAAAGHTLSLSTPDAIFRHWQSGLSRTEKSGPACLRITLGL